MTQLKMLSIKQFDLFEMLFGFTWFTCKKSFQLWCLEFPPNISTAANLDITLSETENYHSVVTPPLST